MTTHDLERLARRSVEAFNRDDWEWIHDIATTDYTYEETGTGQHIEGIEATILALQAWKAAIPDCTGTVLRVVADATTTVVEIRWQGTQTGPLTIPTGELPPSDRSFTVLATMWSRWRDGRACADLHHVDLLGLLAQLGALPAPSSA